MDRRYRIKPPRRRNGRVPPTAILLLLAIATLPIWLFLWPREGFPDGGWERRPPTYALMLDDLSYAATDSAPTVGMSLVASRYGTITRAPFVRAEMVDPRIAEGKADGMVAADVARFVKAWPRASLVDPGRQGELTTLGSMIDYGAGAYLTLRDGCLHAVSPFEQKRFLIVGAWPPSVFRDPENYLAIGRQGGAAEYRLRIGERGGVILMNPIDDAQLDGVAALRKLCGKDPIALLSQAKRLPDCPQAILDAEAERRRIEQAAYDRAVEDNAACIANYERRQREERGRNGPVTPPPSCYPIPPSPREEMAFGTCRPPDAPVERPSPPQLSYGSSRQP